MPAPRRILIAACLLAGLSGARGEGEDPVYAEGQVLRSRVETTIRELAAQQGRQTGDTSRGYEFRYLDRIDRVVGGNVRRFTRHYEVARVTSGTEVVASRLEGRQISFSRDERQPWRYRSAGSAELTAEDQEQLQASLIPVDPTEWRLDGSGPLEASVTDVPVDSAWPPPRYGNWPAVAVRAVIGFAERLTTCDWKVTGKVQGAAIKGDLTFRALFSRRQMVGGKATEVSRVREVRVQAETGPVEEQLPQAIQPLIDQAKKLVADGKYDQALDLLRKARDMRPSVTIEREIDDLISSTIDARMKSREGR